MPTEHRRQAGDEESIFIVWAPENEGDQPVNIARESLRRTETLWPMPSRKAAHVFVEARKALCRNHVFRREILRLRTIYCPPKQTDTPFPDLQTQKRFEFDVAQICDHWQIPDAGELISWLARNWDPTTSEQPPDGLSIPSQGIWPWSVNLEYWRESKEHPPTLQRAIITLNSGISHREAQKATELAVKALRPARNHGGRPGLTEIERQTLRHLFNKLGTAKSGMRQKIIRQAVEAMRKVGKPLGESTVAVEYRSWLKDQGHTVKGYSH